VSEQRKGNAVAFVILFQSRAPATKDVFGDSAKTALDQPFIHTSENVVAFGDALLIEGTGHWGDDRSPVTRVAGFEWPTPQARIRSFLGSYQAASRAWAGTRSQATSTSSSCESSQAWVTPSAWVR
jgi:hypothetical protein